MACYAAGFHYIVTKLLLRIQQIWPPGRAFALFAMSLKRVSPEVVDALRRKLRDPATSLEAKYRVLFSLRGIQGSEAHAAMLEGTWRCSQPPRNLPQLPTHQMSTQQSWTLM